MAATDVSGIRHKIYLAGRMLIRDPSPVQLAPARWESRTRLSNMGMRVDRGFIASGYPNILDKVSVMVPYSNVAESTLLEHLTTVASIGQPFDLCTFKQHKDVFDCDGTRTLFFLQRRVAAPVIEVIEPGFGAEYANAGVTTRIEIFASPYGTAGVTPTTPYTVVYKTEAQIAAGTPASGEAWISSDGFSIGGTLSKAASMELNPAPAAGTDCLIVTYVPLYRMTIESDAGRTFSEALTEARSLRLTEV